MVFDIHPTRDYHSMVSNPQGDNIMQVNLAQHTSISGWKPDVGDFIVWHGWLQHWFGVVSAVNDDEVTIIRKGIPILLFTLTQSDYDKNKLTIGLSEIRSGGSFWHGTYSAIKAVRNNIVWYV